MASVDLDGNGSSHALCALRRMLELFSTFCARNDLTQRDEGYSRRQRRCESTAFGRALRRLSNSDSWGFKACRKHSVLFLPGGGGPSEFGRPGRCFVSEQTLRQGRSILINVLQCAAGVAGIGVGGGWCR